MRWVAAALFVFSSSALSAQAGRDTALRVLRQAPDERATPGAYVTVTFDRPVAGALDRSVNASEVLRIEPAIAGSVAWRDPVTLRFLPAEPVAPGRRFTVTIDTTFRALDGSRLAAPYRFGFRVPGPALLAHAPRAEYGAALGPNEKLYLLYSAPVDLASLGRVARLELGCDGGRRVKLTPRLQRPRLADDPYWFQHAGGWDRDTVGDRFRRVVELAPESTIPGDCDGYLVVPDTLDATTGAASEDRLRVRTRPSFRVHGFECWEDPSCASGRVALRFTVPVRREDVLRYVRIEPGVPFTLPGGGDDRRDGWVLQARLAPRARYTLVVDSALHDAFGRPLAGSRTRTLTTADRAPLVGYATGLTTIPARGPRALPLRHVNVDTVTITVYTVAERARARAIALNPWRPDASRAGILRDSVIIRRALRGTFNQESTTLIPVAELAARAGATGLFALRVDIAAATPAPGTEPPPPVSRSLDQVVRVRARGPTYPQPMAILQVSDLAAHAKLSGLGGVVFVTGLTDGRPRRGARVTVFDESEAVVARGITDDAGLAVLTPAVRRASTTRRTDGVEAPGSARYVEVSFDGDRSITPLGFHGLGYYDVTSLDPERLGGRSGDDDGQLAGAVFTERGIYRPGEMLYTKAIVRTGVLGALSVPARRDSVRWVITHAQSRWESEATATVRDTVAALSAFGTAVDSFRLRRTLPLGHYEIEVRLEAGFGSRTAARGEFTLAEYRAPEFLVTARADSAPKYVGDTAIVRIAARYLFGAPMAAARARWSTKTRELDAWELSIPNTEGWTVGESWWDWSEPRAETPQDWTNGQVTLDSAGRVTLPFVLRDSSISRPTRVELSVAVTDVNRQAITATTAVTVHPASVYIAARHAKASWLWTVDAPHEIELRTVRPDGQPAPDVPVRIVVLHRRWAHVGEQGGGYLAGWRVITDTVARDSVTTLGDRPAVYAFTPRQPGEYRVRFTARDKRGRLAATALSAWAVGGRRLWWVGNSPYHLAVVPSRERLAPGDTAAVTFDAPFESAEAWVTVEREGILDQQRLSVRRGLTTVRVPMTERHAPNVFVSVVLVKTPDPTAAAVPDSAPEVLRAGYAELRVDPGPKRLRVSVTPLRREYGPGDTAALRLRVHDARGRGVRSDVAVWAVDEGVLALTAFRTPDPVGSMYEPRGLGLRLRSTLPSVVAHPALLRAALRAAARARGASAGAVQQAPIYPQLNEVVVTGMEVPVQPGEIPADVLRSEFRSTAFFLGAIVTDDTGAALASAKLPDNLTTYRLVAVAVSDGDRYGSGDSTLLVTRPLVARPALPRFVRASDSLVAGTAVNARDGAVRPVRVDAQVDGAALRGFPRQTVRLEAGRGAEARFVFQVPPRDSARDAAIFRFSVAGDLGRDAVETRLDVRPDFHPRAHTVVGVVRDETSVLFRLPPDIDPARSRLTLRLGSSPLVPMLAAHDRLRVYPYYCTEQISSGGRALVAVYRATRGGRAPRVDIGADPLGRLQQLADEISLRQREDGAIGLWHRADWSTPWLSAYAGLFLLDAREAGVKVEERVIGKLAEHLQAALADSPPGTGVTRSERLAWRLGLGHRVAAADFLRRAGRPDLAAEARLLARADDMVWEDRLRLAEVLAPRRGLAPRVAALLDHAWVGVAIAGGRVDLPGTVLTRRDFPSRVGPAARLLTATLALRHEHPLLGPLVETVLQQGRAEGGWAWNTQDYASVVTALAKLEQSPRPAGPRRVQVTSAAGTLFDRVLIAHARDEPAVEEPTTRGDSAVALTGLLRRDGDGAMTLPLRITATEGAGHTFYALTVEEVPARPPVTPEVKGIAVERWYERFDTGKPVTSVEEGELVRVRLRVTVPSDRHFVVVDDALPAGLEPVDLSLRTSGTLGPFATPESDAAARYGDRDRDGPRWQAWLYGSWDNGWWSPWDYKEIRDDRVVYFARVLWKGTYTASYVARATTRGDFVRPPAHAEEMYNPALYGRSDGGRFSVTGRTQ